MNIDHAKNVLANVKLIEAYVAGKEIQFLYDAGQATERWATMPHPSFNADPRRYRVKPEEVKVKYRLYLYEFQSHKGRFVISIADTEVQATNTEQVPGFRGWISDWKEHIHELPGATT